MVGSELAVLKTKVRYILLGSNILGDELVILWY